MTHFTQKGVYSVYKDMKTPINLDNKDNKDKTQVCSSNFDVSKFIDAKIVYLHCLTKDPIHKSLWGLTNVEYLKMNCFDIDNCDFSNYHNLKILSITASNVLIPIDFSNLINLKTLTISLKNFIEIDFSKLVNLENLEINCLILNKTVNSLQKLRKLILTGKIDKYPNYLELLHVEELHLIEIDTTDNPVFVESLTNLKYLTIVEKTCKEFALDFKKIQKIERLCLINNKVNTTIRYLTELKSLHYEIDNGVNGVFPKIFNCNLLETVILVGSLFNFPIWIDELQELKTLIISPKNIPESLFELKNLKRLQLKGKITTISESIFKLENLDFLLIENINSVPESFQHFQNFKNITYVDKKLICK